MANVTEILNDYILIDKPITLAFYSVEELKDFKSRLHHARRRLVDKTESLGFGAADEGKQIQCTIVSRPYELPIKATFILAGTRRARNKEYEIISDEPGPS